MRRYSPGMPIITDHDNTTAYAPWAIGSLRQSRVTPLLWTRLMQRPTVDPSQADIFIKFLMPFEPPFYEWTESDKQLLQDMGEEDMSKMSNPERLSMNKSCMQAVDSSTLLNSMVHLNRQTQRRHFIAPYWPLFECVRKVSGSARASVKKVKKYEVAFNMDQLSNSRAGQPPLLSWIDTPYIANVRWSKAWERGGMTPPWHSTPERRKYLGAQPPPQKSLNWPRPTSRALCLLACPELRLAPPQHPSVAPSMGAPSRPGYGPRLQSCVLPTTPAVQHCRWKSLTRLPRHRYASGRRAYFASSLKGTVLSVALRWTPSCSAASLSYLWRPTSLIGTYPATSTAGRGMHRSWSIPSFSCTARWTSLSCSPR